MRKNKFITGGMLIFLFFSFGCKKIEKSDAEYERENWIASFNDSIEYYQNRKDKIEESLSEVNSKINKELNNFELIKKDREVSGYYLLKGWGSKIPLKSTGVYARINENEKLELIATLAGNTFNQVQVEGGNHDIKSEVMPHDQAFNFRHERFNTVYFSGGKTDTIMEYIALHHQDKLNLMFLEGKVKQKFTIPENEKEIIYKTWTLYDAQLQARKLQRELWITSQKIATFRRILETDNSEKQK